MKATFNRKVLQAAFSLASQASPTSTPKAVLKNVLLTAAGSTAVLLATDNEVSIRVTVPDCQAKQGGKVLLPAGRFKQILSTVESDGIDLALIGTKCNIKAGRSTLDLTTEDPDSFPEVSEFKETEYRVIAGHVLKTAIQRVGYATDQNPSRYALSGVLFDFRDEKTCFVALDGRRLSLVESKAPETESGSTGMNGVIPANACRLIERCIEGDEDVFVAITGNNIHVKCGNSTISARLVEGRYPQWEQVIPDTHEHSVTVPCGEFMSAINQASLVLPVENKGLLFTFDDGNLTIQAEGQDIGKSVAAMPVSWDSPTFSIQFDGKLIVDFLKTLGTTDPVEILLNGTNDAAVFFAGDGYRYIVMPLADN